MKRIVPAEVSVLTIGEHLAPGAYYLTIQNSSGKKLEDFQKLIRLKIVL